MTFMLEHRVPSEIREIVKSKSPFNSVNTARKSSSFQSEKSSLSALSCVRNDSRKLVAGTVAAGSSWLIILCVFDRGQNFYWLSFQGRDRNRLETTGDDSMLFIEGAFYKY